MSLLTIEGLRSGYGSVNVLHEINLSVEEGELVSVIGPNGAGKSTLLRAISGLGDKDSGRITIDGTDITNASPATIAALGIAHVPENRRVFPAASVAQNLGLGGWVRRRDRKGTQEDLERIYVRFPILRERATQPAGLLSGGQQQMLAIGMALMARPRVLLLDEPSLGLAPLLVKEIFEEIDRVRQEGTTILLVEQFAGEALRIADRGVVLQLGHVVMEGTAAELREDADVVSAYLG